jgi:hypothetical protein
MSQYFKNVQDTFNLHIAKGNLSIYTDQPNYAGDYMYMHSDQHGDWFKHIVTRKYICFRTVGAEARA